jgi:hypothetical protein
MRRAIYADTPIFRGAVSKVHVTVPTSDKNIAFQAKSHGSSPVLQAATITAHASLLRVRASVGSNFMCAINHRTLMHEFGAGLANEALRL